MKKQLLLFISTFSLALILIFSVFQPEYTSANSVENPRDLLIEPLGYEDHLRSCSGTFNDSKGQAYAVSGKNKALKSGDVVSLFWRAYNPSNSKNVTSVLLECKVR